MVDSSRRWLPAATGASMGRSTSGWRWLATWAVVSRNLKASEGGADSGLPSLPAMRKAMARPDRP